MGWSMRSLYTWESKDTFSGNIEIDVKKHNDGRGLLKVSVKVRVLAYENP